MIAQGRHVITQKSIKTAEVVLVSDPYTVIANEVSISNVCASCFTFRGNDVDHDEHCEHCEEAWYCNETCKAVHWETLHKLECPFMKKVKAYELTSKFSKAKLRSLIRLLVKRDLENNPVEAMADEKKDGAGAAPTGDGADSIGTGTPIGRTGPKFIDVESLIAHNEDTEDDAEELEILKALKTIIDPKYIGTSTDDYILKLMSRSECNQFGLWSPDDDLLGLSLHPSASFFNHSCIPNCYSEWSGINLVFKALYPIPAGSELTISYIDAHSQTRQRREELRNAYYFTCICNRCSKGNSKYPRQYYDDFYQRYLRCPKGPGLMRLDSYQGEPEVPESSEDESDSANTKKVHYLCLV
jgi:SET and MYND domain-containing protein